MTKPRVTFIVQRYGIEVNGGAELHCRWIAELMREHWDVAVLTTCAQDYMTWRNVYPPGEDRVNGIRVHRFPVDQKRNLKRFNKLSDKIFRSHHPSYDELTLMKTQGPDGTYADELKWLKAQGPNSSRLLEHLQKHQAQWDLFIFFTYMYATTYFGLQVAPQKSLLVPTAHDEPMIYLSIYQDFFRQPKGFAFNTPEERDLLVKKFNVDCTYSDIIGVGTRVEPSEQPSEIKLPRNYVVYVGRVDESKGCGQLLDFWHRYKKNNESNLHLVLSGGVQMKIPGRKDVISLGFISDSEIYNVISHARCLIMPSFYESFSIVLLEAWLCGRPVLVNGNCNVLKGQCRRSNGGLWYVNYDEFESCLNYILNHENTAAKMALSGKQYTEENYDFDIIKDKYNKLVQGITGQ